MMNMTREMSTMWMIMTNLIRMIILQHMNMIIQQVSTQLPQIYRKVPTKDSFTDQICLEDFPIPHSLVIEHRQGPLLSPHTTILTPIVGIIGVIWQTEEVKQC